jgi:Fe-S-cluster containining protein
MTERLVTVRQMLRVVRERLYDVHEHGRRAIERDRGRPPTCKPDCAYCCYAKILVSVADGLVIYLSLRSQWSPALEKKLLTADRELTAHSHAEWLPLRKPCVFLRERAFGSGSCSIYPVRPLACATTFSVTANPADCAQPGGAELAAVVSQKFNDSFAQMMANIAVSFGESEWLIFTLPGAVLYARALVENLPPPDVHRIPLQTPGTLEHVFDRTGVQKGATP